MKNLKLRFASGFAAVVSAVGLAHAQQIQVVVEGEPVHFRGQPPIEVNDRVLVPLRGVLEDLGAQVNWNPMNQTVTARRGDTRILLPIGQRTASVDDKPIDLDVPAQVVNGSTMVPLRFVSEALGEQVHWQAQTQTVSIFQDHDYAFDRDNDRKGKWRRDEGGEPEPTPPPPAEVEMLPAPPQPLVLDVDTVLPTELNINMRHWRAGDRVSTVIRDFPGLPPNCEVSGLVTQIGSGYYTQPRTINFHFDTLTTPDGRQYRIDASAVPLHSRAAREGGPYDEAAAAPLGRLRSGRIGIRLNRPLRIREGREVIPPRDPEQN